MKPLLLFALLFTYALSAFGHDHLRISPPVHYRFGEVKEGTILRLELQIHNWGKEDAHLVSAEPVEGDTSVTILAFPKFLASKKGTDTLILLFNTEGQDVEPRVRVRFTDRNGISGVLNFGGTVRPKEAELLEMKLHTDLGKLTRGKLLTHTFSVKNNSSDTVMLYESYKRKNINFSDSVLAPGETSHYHFEMETCQLPHYVKNSVWFFTSITGDYKNNFGYNFQLDPVRHLEFETKEHEFTLTLDSTHGRYIYEYVFTNVSYKTIHFERISTGDGGTYAVCTKGRTPILPGEKSAIRMVQHVSYRPMINRRIYIRYFTETDEFGCNQQPPITLSFKGRILNNLKEVAKMDHPY
jgi:hypothetical protein